MFFCVDLVDWKAGSWLALCPVTSRPLRLSPFTSVAATGWGQDGVTVVCGWSSGRPVVTLGENGSLGKAELQQILKHEEKGVAQQEGKYVGVKEIRVRGGTQGVCERAYTGREVSC